MAPTNICEKHGLSPLLQHVLSPDYQLKKGYIDACPNYIPLRSGYDLAPQGQGGFHVEGAAKVWSKVDDGDVERVIQDVVVNGYRSDVGGELLDTRLLGDETTKRAVAKPSTAQNASTAPTAGVKIKLKIKK